MFSSTKDDETPVPEGSPTVPDDDFNFDPKENRGASTGAEKPEYGPSSNRSAFQDKTAYGDEQIEVQSSNTSNAIASDDSANKRKKLADLEHSGSKHPSESDHDDSSSSSQIQIRDRTYRQKRKRKVTSEEERDGEKVDVHEPCKNKASREKRARLTHDNDERAARSDVHDDESVDLHQ